MDYQEFEYIICSHLYFGAYAKYSKIWFIYNPNDKRQRHFVDKNKNLTPDEFDKMWLPLCERQKVIRNRRLEEFKNLKSSAFTNMSLTKKIHYIEAITATKRSTEEWDAYFTPEIKNKLKACLFSIQLSKKFLLEEQRDLNHFMNALIGTGFDRIIRETNTRSMEQRKQDMYNFIDLFCKVHKIDKPNLHFKELPINIGGEANVNADVDEDNGKFTYNLCININEHFMQSSNANKLINLEFLFHELVHIRQYNLLFRDNKEYPMFSKVFDTLDRLTSDKYFNFEINTLIPKESHAYYMQRKFEEQYNKRIINQDTVQNNLNNPNFPNFPQFARTVWYDYQK